MHRGISRSLQVKQTHRIFPRSSLESDCVQFVPLLRFIFVLSDCLGLLMLVDNAVVIRRVTASTTFVMTFIMRLVH